MARLIFTYFIFLVFAVFIVTPTVISIVDDSYDISTFYKNVSEEENHKNEVLKNLELKFLDQSIYQNLLVIKDDIEHSSFYQNTYTSLSLDLQYPPPELHII